MAVIVMQKICQTGLYGYATAALPFAGSFGATAPGKIVHEASSYHGTSDERFGGGNPQWPHAISASVKLVRC